MDSYQAVYDAVRSRIGPLDSGRVVDAIASQFDISFARTQIQDEFSYLAHLLGEPSAVYKPKVCIDGNKWIALYGDNLQDGVAGVGDSPSEAMDDFNREWYRKLNSDTDKGTKHDK